MIIGHGGNKKVLARELGCTTDDINDMSSNLNPLGPPERIQKVLLENLSAILSLPEPDGGSMAKGFAQYHDIHPDRVLPGNGTTWFIYTIPHALGVKNALILGPTYSDYLDGCRMHGVDVTHWITRHEKGFQVDLDQVSDLAGRTGLVFICNPNNPTGTLLAREEIAFLLDRHPDTVFVVDESYLPFVDNAGAYSFVSGPARPNLLVLSSMSKIFRIPGLRTGFLSGAKALVDAVAGFYQPWSVNSLAQAVITDIFDHPGDIEPFYRRTREFITTEKQVFMDAISDLPGLEPVAGHTYFILARLANAAAPDFCRAVGRDRILIRDCSNFHGLDERFVRFSLKTREENLDLAHSIQKALTKNEVAHG